MTGSNDNLPETAAAASLRLHLEETARERDKAHLALQEREAELARVQRISRVGGVEVDLRDGFKNRHSKPMNASTTRGGWGTRQPRPEDRQSGRSSGIVPGAPGRAVLSVLKRAACVSVSVTPGAPLRISPYCACRLSEP